MVAAMPTSKGPASHLGISTRVVRLQFLAAPVGGPLCDSEPTTPSILRADKVTLGKVPVLPGVKEGAAALVRRGSTRDRLTGGLPLLVGTAAGSVGALESWGWTVRDNSPALGVAAKVYPDASGPREHGGHVARMGRADWWVSGYQARRPLELIGPEAR